MLTRYYTKFCGITSLEDALNAQNSHCDALGFVFVKKSKRYINADNCQKILTHLSPFTITVGLFANNNQAEIESILNYCSLHILQFHGNESQQFCAQFKRPYWKAIPMADGVDPIEYIQSYPDAQGFIIDNFGVDHSGGSGVVFDWKKLPTKMDCKWILAGGLTVNNIYLAKTETQFKCFDVSTGIEKYPGKKSKTKMKQFIHNLNKTI